MKKSMIVIGLAVSVIALNGCSTARGFGQDLEDLGRIIQGENATNYEQNRSKSTASTSNLSGTASVGTSSGYASAQPKIVGSTTYVTDPSISTSATEVTTYPYASGSTSGAVSQVTPSYSSNGQVTY